jgi:hypothetical protein
LPDGGTVAVVVEVEPRQQVALPDTVDVGSQRVRGDSRELIVFGARGNVLVHPRRHTGQHQSLHNERNRNRKRFKEVSIQYSF